MEEQKKAATALQEMAKSNYASANEMSQVK